VTGVGLAGAANACSAEGSGVSSPDAHAKLAAHNAAAIPHFGNILVISRLLAQAAHRLGRLSSGTARGEPERDKLRNEPLAGWRNLSSRRVRWSHIRLLGHETVNFEDE
jgi:hypothetical protein